MTDPITLPVIFDDGSTKNVSISAKENRFAVSLGSQPIGELLFSEDRNEWTHTGPLSYAEQIQIAGFIQNYTDTEWDN